MVVSAATCVILDCVAFVSVSMQKRGIFPVCVSLRGNFMKNSVNTVNTVNTVTAFAAAGSADFTIFYIY